VERVIMRPATVLFGPFVGPHYGIAVDATGIYRTTFFGDISKCPLSGCPDSGSETTLVTTNRAIAIAIDDANIYWSEFPFPTVDSSLDGAIRSCPKSGCDLGAALVLAAGFIAPYGLAVDDQDLFYTDELNGRVERMPKQAGGAKCGVDHFGTCCTGSVLCDGTCSVPCGEAGAGGAAP
jgi:hypothetical protein